jgi:hypothetical protein
MKNIKIISLLSGNENKQFDGNTYEAGDNLTALIRCNGTIAEMKVISANDVDSFSYEVLTDKEQMDIRFEEWLESFLEENNPRGYLIENYQTQNYPFVLKDNVINVEENIVKMMQWTCKNLKEDQQITIVDSTTDCKKAIVIKRNDIGISVDHYSDNYNKLEHAFQYYFDDFEDLLC